MLPRLSIIVLNWNNWRDTLECLESLYRIDYPNYDIIVVDNGSKNKSIEKIKEYAEGKLKVSSKFFEYTPENKPIKVFEMDKEDALRGKFNRSLYEKYDPNRRLILIKSKKNLGYTGGNNVGIKFALSVLNPDYIFLLNNDTVVAPDFLRNLINASKEIGKLAVIGPKIMYYNNPKKAQFLGAKYYTKPFFKIVFDSLSPNREGYKIPTDEVNGAAIMIKRDILIEVGLLDDNYFAYWEETDFCLRAKDKGANLYIIPSSRVWHKIGTYKDNKLNPLSTYFFGRNIIYLLQKNFRGINKIISLVFVFVILTPLLVFSYSVYHRDLKATLMFLRGLSKALTKDFQRYKETREL